MGQPGERVVSLDMRVSQSFVNHSDNTSVEDPSFE